MNGTPMKLGYFQRELPASLVDLADLALDLRWNNCPAARHIWSHLDPEIWERTENPLLVLESASQERINLAATDERMLSYLAAWRQDVDEYYAAIPEFHQLDPERRLSMVAYFSMEFGLSESLPIYSGGLGMLAGDHLKTASDIGLPLVGIGLLYQQGYFRQLIEDDGQQVEAYPFNDPGSLPIRPLADRDGQWLRIRLPLPGRELYLRVWEAHVGRVRLLLLDSNDAMNSPWDRGITAQLYDAGRDKRLLQEIVLGLGGWRLIEKLELPVDVCHLNEGHAALAVLARTTAFANLHRVSLPVAFTATRAGNVFTTHTPVEAAFDRFDPKLLQHYAQPFLREAGFELDDVLSLGRTKSDDDSEPFNMAWLAAAGAGYINAVSQLHGEVSRALFSGLFPRWPLSEVPIRAITNGVHVPTWASRRAARLWGDEDGQHLWLNGLEHVSDRIRAISARDLWEFRTQQRLALLQYIESRYCTGGFNDQRSSTAPTFDPNVLTLGFARRFATYKRANLLLSDPVRLKRLLLHERRPVQLIVAGKAHPDDDLGKALITQMTEFLGQPELAGRAIFLEDYDMVLGQHMVAGVDVWLNTPVRLNEACGTSGMKVLVNGGLNVSVLDGWWDEALDGAADEPPPGWSVGTRDSGSFEELYRRDAESLYRLLEHEVVPAFYDRDADGIPHRWIDRVKASMSGLTPKFSATRMLHEYIQHSYLPAARGYANRRAHHAELATGIRAWTDQIRHHWTHVRIGQVRTSEQNGTRSVSVECWLDNIAPDAIRVELYGESCETGPRLIPLQNLQPLPGAVNGYLFSGSLPPGRSDNDYSVRVVPHHPEAIMPVENQCICWDR